MRKINPADQFINTIDQGIRTLFGAPLVTERPDPAKDIEQDDSTLNDKQKRLVVGLMRINHAGEVSAQGLYQGQALTAHTEEVRHSMAKSAQEENDHLDWCERRVKELDGHVSFLNPVWYAGSFTLGAIAGAAGDKWSLGFVAETEKQVVKHLDEHLQQLPQQDKKSQAILEKMKEDELHHATVALEGGGAPLPLPIRKAMGHVSKIMTKTAFHI